MQLFNNGKDGFDYLIGRIQKAESSIEIQMFIWREDELGLLIAEEVLKAAERGVKISIRKDRTGGVFEHAEELRSSFFYHKLPLRLRLMSFAVHIWYPVKGKPRRHSGGRSDLLKHMSAHENISLDVDENLDDHSKYIIIDNEHLVISGMNFEYKEWKHDLQGRLYHDYMLGISSRKAVEQFRTELIDNHSFIRDISRADKKLDFIMNNSSFNCRAGIINRLHQAECEISIVMAYIDDPDIITTLAAMASRVNIYLHIPMHANLQNDLNLHNIRKLMIESGNRINLYLCRDMIHGKLVLIDGNYITFGSANFNDLAMRRLKETNIGFFSKQHSVDSVITESIRTIRKNSVKISDYKDIEYSRLKTLIESFC